MMAFDSDRRVPAVAQAVIRKTRYVRDAASNRFLETLLGQAADHVDVVEPGMPLWRAALGHDWMDEVQEDCTFQVPTPHPPDRMRPLSDRAKEGRANAKGIPCLYLATHRDTALAEVRPWIARTSPLLGSRRRKGCVWSTARSIRSGQGDSSARRPPSSGIPTSGATSTTRSLSR